MLAFTYSSVHSRPGPSQCFSWPDLDRLVQHRFLQKSGLQHNSGRTSWSLDPTHHQSIIQKIARHFFTKMCVPEHISGRLCESQNTLCSHPMRLKSQKKSTFVGRFISIFFSPKNVDFQSLSSIQFIYQNPSLLDIFTKGVPFNCPYLAII